MLKNEQPTSAMQNVFRSRYEVSLRMKLNLSRVVIILSRNGARSTETQTL
jgi:hypothetical protein